MEEIGVHIHKGIGVIFGGRRGKGERHMTTDIQICQLNISYKKSGYYQQVLKNIEFSIKAGTTMALVGETGCGKSTVGKAMIGLLPKQALILSGEIQINGENILKYNKKQWLEIRESKISIIFQEPISALNPVVPIGKQIEEAVGRKRYPQKKERKRRVIELLEEVGIQNPQEKQKCYPHQISGGQRQRVMIAMALAKKPELLIADEPTTALDAVVQNQILELLKKMQQKYHMSILLITHDFAVVKNMAEYMAVLLDGEILEQGKTKEILKNPQSSYTKKLLSCIPAIDRPVKKLGK